MSAPEIRFSMEFSAPAGADIQEINDDTSASSEPPLSPLLEVLRAALHADHRWTLARVSSLPPDMNGEPPLLVWVSSRLPREEVQAGVYDLVADVIHGAVLRRMTQVE